MRLAVLAVLMLMLAGCGDNSSDPTTTGPDSTTTGPAPVVDGCDGLAGFPIDDPIVRFRTNMGVFEAEVCTSLAPVTGNNFLDLTREGFYDGTKFHRIIGTGPNFPEGFMMQGGDPNSRDDDPDNDGRGGPGYAIPDEFHPRLGHELPGTLSMANSGPNSGGSQFFVTFNATPHLDGNYAVFGRITSGMDVVYKIRDEAASTEENGVPPKVPVLLERAEVIHEGSDEGPGTFRLWAPLDTYQIAPGGQTHVLVAFAGESIPELTVATNVTLPNGTYEQDVTMANGRGNTMLLAVDQPGTITVEAAGQKITIEVVEDADAGPETVQQGQQFEGNYIGITSEGFLFDTSLETAAEEAIENSAGFFHYQKRPVYQAVTFRTDGVIQGFADLAMRTPVGATEAGLIPSEQAYGDEGHPLAGQDLVFVLQVIKIV